MYGEFLRIIFYPFCLFSLSCQRMTRTENFWELFFTLLLVLTALAKNDWITEESSLWALAWHVRRIFEEFELFSFLTLLPVFAGSHPCLKNDCRITDKLLMGAWHHGELSDNLNWFLAISSVLYSSVQCWVMCWEWLNPYQKKWKWSDPTARCEVLTLTFTCFGIHLPFSTLFGCDQ